MPESAVLAAPSPAAASPAKSSAAPSAPAPTPRAVPGPTPQTASVTPNKAPSATRNRISEALRAAATMDADGSVNEKFKETPKPLTPPSVSLNPALDSVRQDKTAVENQNASNTDTPDEQAKGETQAKIAGSQDEDKKLGPWQLKAKWEKTAKALEGQVAELRQRLAKVGDVEAVRQENEKYANRIKELEESVRYVDYTKTSEYKEQFEQPYIEAWKQAASDLAEITITDGDGNARVAKIEDLAYLANLPLGEAHKAAREMFGDLADEVMAHRRKVRELATKQQKAVEDNKKNAADRETKMTTAQRQVVEQTSKLWQEFNSQDEKERDFLKTKEGDESWNSALTKAKEFVDKAFSANSMNPNLSPEDRAKIVRDHASIRGRAIGFSMLRHENVQLKAALAAKDKVISEFKQSEPSSGDGHKTTTDTVAASGRMESIKDKIRRLANK